MTNLRNFIFGLMASFGLPWLVLIVIPAVKARHLQPLPYDKEKDGMEGVFPGQGIYRQGQLVYAREGCSQCHTQMIRPGYWGMLDTWKKGWSSDLNKVPAEAARPTNIRDFSGEPYAYLGVQRNGPDLANAGYRLSETPLAEIYGHLYNPRAYKNWSIMPAFRHLFKVQPVQAQKDISHSAAKLPKKYAAEKGYEIVPSEDAEQLVKYLLSLKKDSPIPGQVVADAKK